MKDDKMSMSSDDLIKLFGRPGEKEAQLARCEAALEREREKCEELERENGDLRYQNVELEKLCMAERLRNEKLEEQMKSTAVENAWLKNCVLISLTGIKNFMHMVKHIEMKALFLTFLQKTMAPEMGARGLQAVNEAVDLTEASEIAKLADQLIVDNKGEVTHL